MPFSNLFSPEHSLLGLIINNTERPWDIFDKLSDIIIETGKSLSDNEYVRRYHFVEGLARDWKGVEIQEHTQTKKFKSYPTPFSTRKGAADAFDRLFKKFTNSILIVSYSSNSLPTQDEMVAIMAKYKEHVEVVPIDYKYSFGNQNEAKTHRNSVQEYLFVGY